MLFFLLSLQNSFAGEVFWDGHYRSQGHYYKSLSLSDSNPSSVDQFHYINHWFSLRPTWKINSKLAVHSQLDFLYLSNYGENPTIWNDPAISAQMLGFPQGVSASEDWQNNI